MKFAYNRLDDVPTVREGALVPVHVNSGELAVVLLLIEGI
jgi:hypothetical protein